MTRSRAEDPTKHRTKHRTQERTSRAASRPLVAAGTNLVIVRGRVRAAADRRTSAAGEEVVSFDLLVDVGPNESVPVLWESPGREVERVRPDVELVVVGRVRRRFFRVGGATATRTEVCAETVVPVRATARLQRVIGTAIASVGGDGGS